MQAGMAQLTRTVRWSLCVLKRHRPPFSVRNQGVHWKIKRNLFLATWLVGRKKKIWRTYCLQVRGVRSKASCRERILWALTNVRYPNREWRAVSDTSAVTGGNPIENISSHCSLTCLIAMESSWASYFYVGKWACVPDVFPGNFNTEQGCTWSK